MDTGAFLSKLRNVASLARAGATEGERAAGVEALRRLTVRAKIQAADMRAEEAERFLAGVVRLSFAAGAPFECAVAWRKTPYAAEARGARASRLDMHL